MQRRFSVARLLPCRRSTYIICSVSMIMLTALLCVAALLHPRIGVHAAIDDPSMPPSVGINLIGLNDSSTDFLFADAFKTWRLQAAPGQGVPGLDENGWPQGDFQALLWDGTFLQQHTTGNYALRFTGKATLAASGGTLSNQSYDANSNTTTATFTVSQDGQSPTLTFTSTQRTSGSATNTGLTTIQLMRPSSPGSSTSYSFTTTFTDQVKNLISRFSAIRFMDYSATNSNGQVNWSDRRLPQENQEGPAHNSNAYGWEGLGGAWEYAIQLCNETHRDCYINIPEQATGSSFGDTSSYIYKLAQLIAYGSDASGNVYTSTQSNPVHPPLNSNLHLYIEYSNELWNTFSGAFAQSGQNHDAAKAEVQAGGSPLNYDGSTGDWDWAWRRVAKRIKETSEIFRAVFGDSAMMTQVRPLLEWQYGNGQGTTYQELSFLNNYYNNGTGNFVSNPHPPTYYVWGGGGATYSSVNNANGSTVDDIYNSGLSTSDFTNAVVTDAHFAHGFGLRYVSYEGGFNIGGDNPTTLQSQANIDPRALQAETTFQTIFNQAGGDLLMYFNSSGRGPYSMAFPDVYTLNTPKLQAIDAFAQSAQAAPTNGSSVPVTLDGNQWSLNSRGWGTPGSGPVSPFGQVTDQYGTPPIAWTTYTLHASTAGAYNVTVNYSSATTGGLAVYLGSTLLGTASIGNTGGANQNTSAFSVTIPAGVSALRLAATAGSNNYTINSITISSASGTVPTPTPTPTQGGSTPTPTPSSGWTQCASENQQCSFSGTMVVRYGANGEYNYQTATNGIQCANSVFGDPIPGTFKSCQMAPVPPTSWTQCASENNTCTVPGTVTVAYGASGQFTYKTVTGSIGCNSSVFGGDPIVGVYKGCYYN